MMRLARCAFCCFLLILASVNVSAALAQGRDTGAIRGIITDPDGAPLPGVTVTVESDDLIGGSRTTTTSVAGVYRFPGLQPGTYLVRVELQGFRTAEFSAVGVSVGVSLTIDARLDLSGVSETVSVTGEAPLIDTKNSSATSVWGQEQLHEIPSAMDLWSYIQQVPGVMLSKENVGGNESVQLSGFQVHGSEREAQQYNMNGMDMTLFEHGIGLGYFNTDAFEEIQFTTSGISAENSKGGMIINTIVKDGGNDFHGGIRGYYEGPDLQGDNLNQELRDKGVTSTGGNLDKLTDISVDFGGPVVSDSVWFYTAFREYRVTPFVLNCLLPDGSGCTDGSFLTNFTSKVTARLDDSSTLMVNGEWAQKIRANRGVSQFTAPAGSWFQDGRHFIMQGKYNRVFGNNAFLDAYAGWGSPPFPLKYQDGVGNTTSRFDEVTGVRSDAARSEFFSLAHLWTLGSNYTLFKDGANASHDLKLGVEHRRGSYYTRTSHNESLERRYANGVPFRVRVFNSPVEARNHQQVWMGYVQDDVRIGNLTLNLGVRVEDHNASIPQQPQNQGPWVGIFFSEQQAVQPNDSVAGWTTVSPRLGFAWDVKGDGRTVVKGSAGRYYTGIDNSDMHSYGIRFSNRNATVSWNDLNGNDFPDYPDEFNASGIQTLSSSNQFADDFDTWHSDEVSFAVERGLTDRSSLSARYTYRKNSNLWGVSWAGIPTSAYNIPTTAIDPITDAAVDYWSIDPAFVGVDRQQTLGNHEDDYNRYHGVDFIYTRRFDGVWMMTASATISDQYGRVGGFTNRNTAEVFPYGSTGLDAPFAGKVSGFFVAPYDINIGGAYRITSGMNTYGGLDHQMARELLVQDATTGSFSSIRVEENGEFRQDASSILDLRFAKTFRVGDISLEAMVDGFNVLNANTILRTGVLTGSNLNVPRNVTPPRIFRLGLRIEF